MEADLPPEEEAAPTTSPLGAWGAWAANKSPEPVEEKKASPLILVVLLAPPAILVIAAIVALVLK